MDAKIKKAILHVLDSNTSVPVISNKELDMDSTGIGDFLIKHIEKITNDPAAKNGEFENSDNNLVLNGILNLIENGNEFVNATTEISNYLFNLMLKHIDIPAADLIFCLVDLESRNYLAILKMNYRECYTHFVENGAEGLENQLIKHKTILPSDGQRIEDGALICLDDYSVKLVEKVCEIDGEKRNYFSELFLKCKTDLSKKETLRIINKAAQEINQKYYNSSFEKMAEVKSVICELAEEEGNFEIDRLARGAFKDSREIQEEYKEQIYKSGISEKVSMDPSYVEKKVMTQKLKTDTGIEINFPSAFYNNKEMIEIINNPDGTISILIKKVNKITSR
ncbi:MAG: 37-kD nucleoid-associated bacterial protein [Clostridiales bacterium]|nr:37-kD nucleoid-associated bacterial protein [Clostridiales bacterium]